MFAIAALSLVPLMVTICSFIMVAMIISEADYDPTGRTGIGVDHKTTWTIGICCVELAAETARALGSACGRNHHPLLGDPERRTPILAHPQSDEPLEVAQE